LEVKTDKSRRQLVAIQAVTDHKVKLLSNQQP